MTPAQRLGLACQVLPWAGQLPPALDERIRRAIVRALLDVVAVVEEPLDSNRGPMIDAYLRAAHVPESVILAGKGYWCAAAVGQWWQDADLATPPGRASCDHWMAWAQRTGRWSRHPALGAAVLYGVPGDARHIGLVARLTPLVLSIEGNTSIEAGSRRNGIAVAVKHVDAATDPILGYCLPFPAAAPTPPSPAT